MPRARGDRATSSPANLAITDLATLQRAAGNSAVTGLLTVQRAPGGGSGDSPPVVTPAETPEALGTRLGVAARSQPSRFDYIVGEINKARLSAGDAVTAATSATREIGLRMFTQTVGADVVLCSVQPGTGKPVLIVRPDGVVLRGTADIAVANPVTVARPMIVTNVKPNAGPGPTTGPPKVTPAHGERAPVKPASPEVTVPPPKVETPPVGGGGSEATSTRLGVEASRLRTAGRFLAEAAPGLLLQAMLMALFPPSVRIHNDNYDALSRQKIDPALQRALADQAATFTKLAAGDPARSIWASVTVESEYWVEATSGGDLHVHLQDLRFVDMMLTHEYLLVEGPKFQVGAGAKASKKVTYSVPVFGPATRTSASVIANFRTLRKGLTSSSSKVRLSSMLNLYKIADAESFLKSQLVRDLRPMLGDDDSTVRKVATRLLSRLEAER